MLLFNQIKDAANGFGQNYNNINVNVVDKPYFIDKNLRGVTRFSRRIGASSSISVLEPQNQLEISEDIVKGIKVIPFKNNNAINWFKSYNSFNIYDEKFSIHSFSNYNTTIPSTTLINSINHELENDDEIRIVESVNYNGTYKISTVDVDNFYINKEYVSSTGEIGKFYKITENSYKILKPIVQLKEQFHLVDKVDIVRNDLYLKNNTIIPYSVGDKVNLYAYPIILNIKKDSTDIEEVIETKINATTLKLNTKHIHIKDVSINNITLNNKMNKVTTKESLHLGDRYFVDEINGVIYFGEPNKKQNIELTYNYNEILIRAKTNNILVLSDILIKSNIETGFYILDEYRIVECLSLENPTDTDYLYDVKIDNLPDFLTKMNINNITFSWTVIDNTHLKGFAAYEADKRYLPNINNTDEMGPCAIDIYSGFTVEGFNENENINLRIENGKEVYTHGGENFYEKAYKNFPVNNCISIKKLILSKVLKGYLNIEGSLLKIYPDKDNECQFEVEFPMDIPIPAGWDTKIFIDKREINPISFVVRNYPNERFFHNIPYNSNGYPIIIETSVSLSVMKFIEFHDIPQNIDSYSIDDEVIIGVERFKVVLDRITLTKKWEKIEVELGDYFIINSNTTGFYTTDINYIAELDGTGNALFWKISTPNTGEEIYNDEDGKNYKFIKALPLVTNIQTYSGFPDPNNFDTGTEISINGIVYINVTLNGEKTWINNTDKWVEVDSGENIRKIIFSIKSDYPVLMSGLILRKVKQVRTISYQIMSETFGLVWNSTGIIAKPMLKSLSNLKTNYNEKDKYNNGNIYLGRI